MLSGRALLATGCVVALAVMVGILGSVVVVFGGIGMLSATRAPQSVRATPTVGYVEVTKPVPGRINVLNANGVAMTADRDGGESFFLANGTPVQILQNDGSRSRVQVMGGQHQNRSGWVPTNSVST